MRIHVIGLPRMLLALQLDSLCFSAINAVCVRPSRFDGERVLSASRLSNQDRPYRSLLSGVERVAISALPRPVQRAVREDGAQAVILGWTGKSWLVASMRKSLAAEGLHVPIVERLRTAVHAVVAWVPGGIANSREAFMPLKEASRQRLS